MPRRIDSQTNTTKETEAEARKLTLVLVVAHQRDDRAQLADVVPLC